MHASRFGYSRSTLEQMVHDLIQEARRQGASDCEAEVSLGIGQNVSVRLGEVETIEYTRDKGIGVTVYFGQRRGNASTSDLTPQALRDTVAKACAIARNTAEDFCAGLAEPHLFARDVPDLDLYHPLDRAVEDAIDLARRCEAAALDVDPRVNNSEGASVGASESLFIYGNSAGFIGGYPTSRYDISCSVIAEGAGGMQRDYWYDSARHPDNVAGPESVGRVAAQRTLRRLDARSLPTCQAPVLFEAPLAGGLIGHLVAAASGGSLYRKSSFLVDALGTRVLPEFVRIDECPHLPRGLASSPFDNEGVATRERAWVSGGILNGYFLGSYSARKLGMQTTGNAGGSHNLVVQPGADDFAALLRRMGRGLVVTELLGHGVNLVTGDYSRGAAGFWVEDGEIAFAVEEVTIAGSLPQMYRQIAAVGNDVLARGARQCGSILVEHMTIAGQT